jgi:hypothetical protein
MEEAPEKGNESSNSAHANGMNERMNLWISYFSHTRFSCLRRPPSVWLLPITSEIEAHGGYLTASMLQATTYIAIHDTKKQI